MSQVKYPGTAAYTIDNLYQNGYISNVKGTYTTTDDIFTATGYNQRGQVTGYTLGNGLTTTRGYDDFGFPTAIQTPGIQNLAYEFNTSTGNLNWRKDVAKNLQENFTYDSLMKNRLETWQVNSGDVFANQYNANGNISSKTWLGSFQYDGARPHAVTSVDNSDNWIETRGQSINYTPFNKVKTIREGDYKLEIIYGPDNQRKMTVLYRDANSPTPLKSAQDVINWVPYKTKYYVGGIFEKEIVDALTDNTSEINYVYGGDGLAAIFVKDNNAEKLYYIHKDHLGSYQAVSDETGALQEELYFSPWGNRGGASTWSYPASKNDGFYGRGFTGHEHLPEFNLINMNGRVYDPILGRFMSPDNYIQAPDYTQNFNRYSYVLNNPLVYTDPTGEKWRWGNPFYHFDRLAQKFMDWVNGKLEPVSNAMVEAGVPPIGVGYNTAHGSFHYLGSSGNQYHSLPGQIAMAEQNVSKQIAGFSGADMESPLFGDVSPGVFVGESPLANGVATGGGGNSLYAIGMGLNAAGFVSSGGEYANVVYGSWRGANGIWYPTTWGGNQWSGARSTVMSRAGAFKLASRGFFVVGTGISLYQGGDALLNGDYAGAAKSGLDIGMGTFATFGGPPGWIIGGGYFLLDAIGTFDRPIITTPYIPPTYAVPDNTYVAPPIIRFP